MAGPPVTSRAHEAALGSIVAILLLAFGALGIYAANGAFGDDYQLRGVTSRAGFGLVGASDVKVRGITVGNVEKVGLQDDGSIELTLNIRREIQVPQTATASIEPASVFGPKFVNLVLGPDEGQGPYLGDGDLISELVAPTELAETLDGVSTLLDEVDEEKFATILSELARGTDGLGDEFGETIDATVDVVGRIREFQPTLEVLIADAAAITDTLAERRDELVSLSTDGQETLRLIETRGDAIGEVLTATSELSLRLDDVVSESAADLGRVIDGLGPAATVLHDHLAQIPEFTAAFRDVTTVLGDTALQWNVGDGRLGAVVRAVVSVSPCDLFPDTLPICPPEGNP